MTGCASNSTAANYATPTCASCAASGWPLSVGMDDFAATLANRRRLKTALTDQSVIAGLGNLLSDEVCWQARINPLRMCAQLDTTEVRTLHHVMRRVLRTSVRHRQVPRLRSWLTGIRDDSDARCPRCGTRISRARNAGRMTLWCPQCQPH
jgi:formamidopyrimidine-DNA glycosylase